MANRPIENTSPKTRYNTEVNNSLAWKVTRNWQVIARNSLLTLSWLWHLSTALIYDSLHLEFPHAGLPLWRTTDRQSHTPSFLLLTVLCVQRATILFLRGQRFSNWRQLNLVFELTDWVQAKARPVNHIPSSEETQSEGVTWGKGRKQGSRKW